MIAFDGTQPIFRQSPPSRLRSISATFAPSAAAACAATSPAGAGADDHQVVAVRGLRIAPAGWVHIVQPLALVRVLRDC